MAQLQPKRSLSSYTTITQHRRGSDSHRRFRLSFSRLVLSCERTHPNNMEVSMRTLLRQKFVLAVFCLLVLPATASADAVVTGPCGSSTLVGQMTFGPCALPGGGSALYGAQATFATNSFLISHSPE